MCDIEEENPEAKEGRGLRRTFSRREIEMYLENRPAGYEM
jgi:hypothetical protein